MGVLWILPYAFVGVTYGSFSYLDDDDGLLLPLEAEAERKAIDKAVAEWKAKKANQSEQTTSREEDDDRDIYAQEDETFGPEVKWLFVVFAFDGIYPTGDCYDD